MDDVALLESYFDRLWPLLRSISGPGVRATHDILGELVPLQRIEVPTGTQVLDWTVPKEWRCYDAYLLDPHGNKILDVAENNLHLLNYSVPYRGRVSRVDLDIHLHSLPDLPDAIPYLTSYYAPQWGFCLSHNQRLALPEGDYDVVVDTELIDGSITLSEAVLPGETTEEVLLSTYTCHPSLANNELTGPLTSAFLYRRLATMDRRRLTYRFIFLPETIGSIAYLQLRGEHLRKHLQAGYVVTCCGDPAAFTYKRSRRGNTLADDAALYVLRQLGTPRVVDFFPSGSDERQYCSPGFNLPVGSIMRSMYGTYPEYHTSFDNKSFVSFNALHESIEAYYQVCQVLEWNGTFQNLSPYGEPQLGKRGLYPSLGSQRTAALSVDALLWVHNYSDGVHDLLWIANHSRINIAELAIAAEHAVEHELLVRLPTSLA